MKRSRTFRRNREATFGRSSSSVHLYEPAERSRGSVGRENHLSAPFEDQGERSAVWLAVPHNVDRGRLASNKLKIYKKRNEREKCIARRSMSKGSRRENRRTGKTFSEPSLSSSMTYTTASNQCAIAIIVNNITAVIALLLIEKTLNGE